jgi:hypothetical protein
MVQKWAQVPKERDREREREEEQEEFFRRKVFLTIWRLITFFGIFKSKHHKMWDWNSDTVSEFPDSVLGLCIDCCLDANEQI